MTQPEAPSQPAGNSARDAYLARQRTLSAEQHALTSRRRLLRIALALCIALAAFLLDRAAHGVLPLRTLIAPAALAVALAPVYLRVQTRLARILRLHVLYDRNLARVDGVEIQSGHLGEEFRDPAHLFDRDLNILGPNSLFGLLATTRTGVGQRGLAHILLRGTTRDQILDRQEAVQELAPRLAVREEIALLGASSFLQVHGAFFDTWLADPPPTFHPAVRPALLLTATLLVGMLLAGLAHLFPWATLLPNLALVAAIQSAVSLKVRPRVRSILEDTRVAGQTQIFSDGLRLLQQQVFAGGKLQALQQHSTAPVDAVATLRRIQNQFVIIEQRPKEYFFTLSLLLALGTHAAISVARWKRSHADAMKLWISTFAEFEALNALANYAFEHPENTYPEVLPSTSGTPAAFHATGLRHPMLPPAAAVPNDIHLDSVTRFYLISGSNMAGKSTLLRAVGVAAVLTGAGAPIPATSARLSLLTLCASISLNDSLADGKSKFLAEVERLHAILQSATPAPDAQPASHPHPSPPSPLATPTQPTTLPAGPPRPPVLFLIDEIFSGTNSADRLTAAAAVLRQLISLGALGALSTHDLALTTLAEPSLEHPQPLGCNVHMASPDPANPLAFDYILKPGINPSTNALAILRLIGIEP